MEAILAKAGGHRDGGQTADGRRWTECDARRDVDMMRVSADRQQRRRRVDNGRSSAGGLRTH